MDPSEYRKQITEEVQRRQESQPGYADFLNPANSPAQRLAALAAGSRPLNEEQRARSIEIIRNSSEEPDLRASAIQTLGRDMGEADSSIDLLIGLLRNASEPSSVRLAALQNLQVLAFTSTLFLAKRPEFLEALRSIVEDPDTAVREAAIEVLALEKDEYVQRRLSEGLDEPSKALVAPERAIQLLGQDVHADLFPRLQAIIQTPPNPAARQEAVRVLSADPNSRDLLVRLLEDKAEDVQIRALSAVSLQALDPVEFTEQAKQMVLDESEDEQLRLTGLTGLTHFEQPTSLIQDAVFEERLRQMMEASPSEQIRDAAARYLNQRR